MEEQYRPLYLALASTPLFVAVTFTTGLAIRRSDAVELGSAGEWVGGLATAVAVGVALWVAIRGGRLREEDRKDQQAAQARLVIVEAVPDMFGGYIRVKVTNQSEAPIFAVVIESIHVSPDPMRVRFPDEHSWARLDAKTTMTAVFRSYEMDGRVLADVREPNLASADVSFVDSAGLRWRRWANTPPRGGASIDRREPPRPLPPVEESERAPEDTNAD